MSKCYFKNSLFCSRVFLEVVAYVFLSVAVFSLALILWDLNSQLPTLSENLLEKFPKVRAVPSK